VPGRQGKAVQVDNINPTLKAPGTKFLKLKYYELLSNVAFKFNLRRYTPAAAASTRPSHSWGGGWQGLILVHFSAQPKPCWSHLCLSPCLIEWGKIRHL